MPRKNREEYNRYMKEYMKNKNKKDNTDDNDFNGTDKPLLDLNGKESQELLSLSKKVFKDPDTGKPDKVLEYIEQGAKYLPLIMKFAEGFMSSMQSFQGNAVQPAQRSAPTIQPPEGWESMGAMEKLKYKYSRPQWYEAGLRWDSYKESGSINPQLNIDYVDPNYRPSREQPIRHDEQQVNSLQELSRKHPEPPLLNEDDKPEEINRHDPKLEKVIQEKQNRNKEVEPMTDDVTVALNQDNVKYIQLAIKYIKDMEFEKFKTNINELDKIVKSIEPFFMLIPIHLKEMIKKTTEAELLDIFKESCPDKFDWCKTENKIDKINGFFNTIKSKL